MLKIPHSHISERAEQNQRANYQDADVKSVRSSRQTIPYYRPAARFHWRTEFFVFIEVFPSYTILVFEVCELFVIEARFVLMRR